MAERSLSFCMITTFYPPYHFGGEAMYVHRLSNELARRGHRVTIVHCVDAYHLLTPLAKEGEFPHHPNVTVHTLRSPFGRLSPVVTYLSGQPGLKSPALRAIFAGESFDVVHFHLVTLFGPGVLEVGGDALRLYTAHDHWLVCPMYDLWRYNRELCDEPQCLRCTLSFRRPPQLWRHTKLLDRSLRKVDVFFAPSRSSVEQHRRRGFPHPMQRLPLFLPVAEATAPGTHVEDVARAARPYFLFVGRLVKLKGVQTLIDAFRRYRAADLLIAGDGSYATELRRRASGLDHVRFLGRVHPDELRSLYAGAVAVLVPSLVYETFGFVTLESLALGTPVIATELGAVGELARESGGGLTYGTEDELLAAITLLQSDPALRSELGARGHAAFLERWSEEPHLERYFAAIDAALERKRAAVVDQELVSA